MLIDAFATAVRPLASSGNLLRCALELAVILTRARGGAVLVAKRGVLRVSESVALSEASIRRAQSAPQLTSPDIPSVCQHPEDRQLEVGWSLRLPLEARGRTIGALYLEGTDEEAFPGQETFTRCAAVIAMLLDAADGAGCP